jgi:hypothetical protein
MPKDQKVISTITHCARPKPAAVLATDPSFEKKTDRNGTNKAVKKVASKRQVRIQIRHFST